VFAVTKSYSFRGEPEQRAMNETRQPNEERADGTAAQEPSKSDPLSRVPNFLAMPSSRQVDCGNFDIHISRDGTWSYRGSPIGRLPLVKLFASVLQRDDEGTYWLATPVERGRITVEDAPFTAVELTVTGEGQEQILVFRTNLDDNVSADENHPLRIDNDNVTRAPNPYILVRDGLEARLTRAVFYQLVDIGREERVGDTTLFGVWSKGQFFPLGSLDESP
jgi:hypothetical protein